MKSKQNLELKAEVVVVVVAAVVLMLM